MNCHCQLTARSRAVRARPEAARWVNPKRQRGLQLIPSLTLRVSVGCLIPDGAEHGRCPERRRARHGRTPSDGRRSGAGCPELRPRHPTSSRRRTAASPARRRTGNSFAIRSRASSRSRRSSSVAAAGVVISSRSTRLRLPPRFNRARSSRVIDQDAPHRLGGSREEMRLAVEVLVPDQPHVSLMHQGGGVEGVPGLLRGHPRGREFPQLVVNERKQVQPPLGGRHPRRLPGVGSVQS